jgi:hypothetical protein
MKTPTELVAWIGATTYRSLAAPYVEIRENMPIFAMLFAKRERTVTTH